MVRVSKKYYRKNKWFISKLFFIYKGERYKILKAEKSNKIGEIGNVLSDNLEIGCKEKSIKILEIQREGKRPQKINEFLLGSKIKKGSNLKDA